jgi:superfamily I DNA and RNA helicase
MIRKEVWLEKFSDTYNADLSHKMIFSDDLTSNSSLSWRLDHLRKHPLLGVYPSFEKNYENKITFVRNVLLTNPYSNISKSKISEIKAPSPKSQEKANEFKFGLKSYVKILRGPPGTGKTTILREIALNHAREGAAVLYLCFNKVLATEQRREFQILGDKNENKGFIHSHDVYEFFKLYAGILPEMDWSTKIDKLLESENFKQLEYDTILIDESQDLEYAVFEMLKYITKKNYSLFISYGQGQELYSRPQEVSPSPFLKNLMQNSENIIRLNRPFRSSKAPFLVAQSFYENAPNFEKSVVWLEKYTDNKQFVEPELALEFSIPPTPDEIEIQYYLNDEMRYSFVKDKIKYILKKIDYNYEDLMILVGPESLKYRKIGNSYSDVLKILEELNAPYTDYVLPDNRKEISNNIKISTLNNSRGLSANFLLVLDFEECQNFVEKRKKLSADFSPTTRNLGYITLSRSKKTSIILLDATKINDSCNFLIKTLTWINDKLI